MARKLLQYCYFICIVELSTLVSYSIARRVEDLDGHGKYFVAWEIENNKIIFEATVETHGLVGFGLSRNGGMTGADIVIGGVLPDGTTYFQDYYGTGNDFPLIDSHQDWFLESAMENETHTIIRFSRLLNTCDPQDIPVNTDTFKVIWSFGNSDEIGYHGEIRGSFSVELMAPAEPDVDVSEFEVWNIESNKVMPSKSTTYWCSVHKAPVFKKKTHIVGFNVRLDTERAKAHLHHIVVWMCDTPHKKDSSYFDKFLGEGHECYATSTFIYKTIPLSDCRDMLYVWAVGGKRLILPEHVGYPIEENKNVYILLEVHYNNPNELQDIAFNTRVEVFHTSKLRKHDAGMLLIDHKLVDTHMVPPKSENFMLVGHCSSGCTKQEIPEGGIYLFNALLHSHLAGRKLLLRHFRDNKELPWVAHENNYIFDYQQNRQLHNEVNILPGDHVTYECTYNTMDRDNITLGGFTTEDEMCQAFIWYYPKIKLRICGSRYESVDYGRIFGIEKMIGSLFSKSTVSSPKSLAGLKFSEVANTRFTWTPEVRNQLQEMLRYGEHDSGCFAAGMKINMKMTKTKAEPRTKYPVIEKEYEPEEEKCENVND